MAKTGAARVKVWSWHGRDVESLADLDMVVGVTSRKELHQVTVRLRLPKPVQPLATVKLGEPA